MLLLRLDNRQWLLSIISLLEERLIAIFNDRLVTVESLNLICSTKGIVNCFVLEVRYIGRSLLGLLVGKRWWLIMLHGFYRSTTVVQDRAA